MKNKQRDELLEILKVLMDEELTWFEVRTPTAYIRIGQGPEAPLQPLPQPIGNGHGSAVQAAPATTAPAASPALAAAPAAPSTPAREVAPRPAVPTERPAPPAAGGHPVTAPFAGVFYRRPSPADPPFVEVGSPVMAADTVCLVEVMKLFNSVHAGVDGVVASIEVEDGSLVEYGQPLMRIEPSGE